MPATHSRTGRMLLQAVGAIALCALGGTLARTAAGTEWTAVPAADFPLAGGNYSNQRYSSLDQIDTTNIGKVGGAWSIHLEETNAAGNLDGAPVVVNGVMYVSTARLNVLAIDAATGRIKWRYRPGPGGPIGANKGVVAGDGRVFVGRRDNVLVALDQNTGEVQWERKLTDNAATYTSAAPVYYDGRVYIGTAGGDNGARGQMGAYDSKTGQEMWKFFTTPSDGQRGAETW